MAYEFEHELEGLGELEGEFEGESELEGELEHESELEGEGWLGAIGNVVGSLLGEHEHEHEHEFEGEGEGEGEFEGEMEGEISPIRKVYQDAMMEHLGELAAEAESEHEAAEHFLPLIGMAASKLLPVVAKAVMPMAKKALPKMARAVTRVTPKLTKGIGTVARNLHRNPQTRPLLKALPSIARRTVGTIARQAARGRTITPTTAVRTLAKQTMRVLGNPRRRAHVLHRHNILERRFHRRWGRGMVRPHGWRYRYPIQMGGGVPASGGVARVPGAAVGRGVPGYVAGGGVAPGVGRVGTMRYGQCSCPPCPSCGVTPGATGAAPAPSYCRCCGQVLR